MTQLFAETVLPIARRAQEVEPPTVLFVSQASSLSPRLTSALIIAQLHTSPTQPLAPVISVTPRAPPALLQRPTARPARLSTTPLQPPSLEPALSVMQPVMNAQAQATQPVKPAIRPITQWTSILPPASILALPSQLTTSLIQEFARNVRVNAPLVLDCSTRTASRVLPLTTK